MQDLKGRTAIVTGAGSGIGSGIANVLTHAGERQAVKARHARIEAAFDRAEEWGKP